MTLTGSVPSGTDVWDCKHRGHRRLGRVICHGATIDPRLVWRRLGTRGGILLCLGVIFWALRKIARYDLVLDRKSQHAFVSIRWPWRERCKVVDFTDVTAVLRRTARPIETPDSHCVSLCKSDGTEIAIFDDPRYDDLQTDNADNMAHAICRHMGILVLDDTRAVEVSTTA